VSRDSTRVWVLVALSALVLVGACAAGYIAYTAVPRAPGSADAPAPDATPGAARDEAAAWQRLEAERQAAEARRVGPQRRKEEEQAHAAALEKSRDEFRTAGRPAPDPDVIPGLVLHIGFDGPDPLWPKSAGQLSTPGGTVRGPGPRGSALYLNASGQVVLWYPSGRLRAGASESVTVAGWVKLRFRPVSLLQVDGAKRDPIGHVSVTGRRVVLDTAKGLDPGAEEPDGSRVSATWERDDQWHHVAAVRERRPGGERAVIYLDGKPIADTLVPPGAEWSTASSWTFARGVEPAARTWPGPAGPPDRDGKPAPLRPDEIAYAVDEICLYERALTPAEVRMLAGIDPVPAGIAKKDRPAEPAAGARPTAVTVARATALPGLSGVVFDPGRGLAWAVTDGSRAELHKLSYPDFKRLGTYWLAGAAGPVAFDPVENRLFVAIRPFDGTEPPRHPDGWPVVAGALHRYDLDGVPAAPSPTHVTSFNPSAVLALPAANPVTALTVTPDGEWVCPTLQVASAGGPIGRLFKLPWHLESAEQYVTGPGLGDTHFPFRVDTPAGGNRAWFSIARGGGDWAVVDLATGNKVTQPSFRLRGTEGRDFAVHPAGDRIYLITDDGGADEAQPVAAGQAGVRRRPLVAGRPSAKPPRVHLRLTGDGRYLFHTGARPDGEIRLTIVDTTAPTEPGTPPTPAVVFDGFGGRPWRGENGAGPFWLSPDGTVAVARAGHVIRIGYPEGRAPVVRPPAPRPKRELAVAPPPRLVPNARPVPQAPSEFPGLKFHLAFDEDAGAGVKESVSGKVVGRLIGGQYVDGVRGKALRLSFVPKPGATASGVRLDLTDQKDVLRVGADTPFTLTMWVRPVSGSGSAFQATRRIDENRSVTLDLSVSTAPRWQYLRTYLESPSTVPHQRWDHGIQIGEWQHLAVVRDGRGAVRFLVNGEEARRFSGNGRFDGELDFETIVLYVSGGQAASTMDLDELCLFDQLLTDEQLAGLAGVRGYREPRPAEPRPAPKDAPVLLADVAKGAALQAYSGRPVPVATELKGLTFYLPCTTLLAGKTPEAVSFTDLATPTAELVDGVRGKALRFATTADGFGLDVSGTASVKAAAGRPFTLATWVRVLNTDRADNPIVLGVTGGPQPTREFVLAVGKGTVELRLGDRMAQGRPGIRIAGPCPEPGRWVHLAVTRDDGGRVRLLVDGAEIVPKGEPIFPHEIGYDLVRLAGGPPRSQAMDLAEFAFYDRALTAAEIRRLAGSK
jgi:hypothetical protein